MKENLLHFIWKLKLFSFKNSQTTTGEIIEITSVGIENSNEGPDFLNAKIVINKHHNSTKIYAFKKFRNYRL